VATEREIHARFVALLRDAHLKVVDMQPIFEKAGNPLGFYFETDPHWNARGHAAAAAALNQFLSADPDWRLILPVRTTASTDR